MPTSQAQKLRQRRGLAETPSAAPSDCGLSVCAPSVCALSACLASTGGQSSLAESSSWPGTSLGVLRQVAAAVLAPALGPVSELILGSVSGSVSRSGADAGQASGQTSGQASAAPAGGILPSRRGRPSGLSPARPVWVPEPCFVMPVSPFPNLAHAAGGAGRGLGKKTKKRRGFPRLYVRKCADYTQPVGLGRPAILQAPLPGPEGKSS